MTSTRVNTTLRDTVNGAPEPVTIASVPSCHVYVRNIAPPAGPGPRRLPDPDPRSPGRPTTDQWWPPVMLDPGWAMAHDFDIFHLHFGFDACPESQLEELLSVLRRRGKPFVFTVHDLRNPHHEDRRTHDRQLDILVPAADGLVTLTPGAADEIRQRWGREVLVLPHPHVIGLSAMQRYAQRERRATTFRVGVHVKSLRASMDPLRVLPTLVDTVGGLTGAELQVNAHRDVLDANGARRDEVLASYLRHHESRGDLKLFVHDYLPDEGLWRYLRSLDVSVLPYRFGTHSGWLEACRDVRTTVVAPSCGYFAQQGPTLSYVHDEERYDAGSLANAVTRAYQERPRFGATVAERRHQRSAIARGYELVYQDVLRGV